VAVADIGKTAAVNTVIVFIILTFIIMLPFHCPMLLPSAYPSGKFLNKTTSLFAGTGMKSGTKKGVSPSPVN
jgi:hypothetical protein